VGPARAARDVPGHYGGDTRPAGAAAALPAGCVAVRAAAEAWLPHAIRRRLPMPYASPVLPCLCLPLARICASFAISWSPGPCLLNPTSPTSAPPLRSATIKFPHPPTPAGPSGEPPRESLEAFLGRARALLLNCGIIRHNRAVVSGERPAPAAATATASPCSLLLAGLSC
jgi:hypothetical protein